MGTGLIWQKNGIHRLPSAAAGRNQKKDFDNFNTEITEPHRGAQSSRFPNTACGEFFLRSVTQETSSL